MDEHDNDLIASNLTVAFFSAVEPLPAFLGKERRKRMKPPEGLDMRNPSVAPSDVFEVYQRFKDLLAKD